MKECPICFEGDQDGDQFGCLEVCRHEFHLNCIREWHKYSIDLKCPICRTESSHLNVGDGQHAVSVDLEMGFMIKHALEHAEARTTGGEEGEEEEQEEQEEEEEGEMGTLSEMLQDGLVIDAIKVIQCGICGDTDAARLNLYCQDCGAIYHETCLRGLACEVGERNAWHECTECRSHQLLELRMGCVSEDQVTSYDSRDYMIFAGEVRDKHSVQTEQMYDRIRHAKHSIQTHVRRALDQYPLALPRDTYKNINQHVSRKLYRFSDNKYLPNQHDYDSLARTAVHAELFPHYHVDI
ncbi:hypothetical protein SEUBUCD646_0P03620 [Saccharomyces eubayanus]|nr:hypothetical protein SEUBUCD646_0P03620 [Saccharomyces eubayanus]